MTEHPESDPLVDRFQRAYRATPVEITGVRRPARPRRVSPMLWPVAAAAALLLLLVDDRGETAPTGIAADSLVTVRFVLATDARRVSVVGDFNGWDPEATPMARTGPLSRWEVNAQIGVGRVEYAFVIDGRTWVPDPTAPLAPATEFGARNSVMTIRPQGAL